MGGSGPAESAVVPPLIDHEGREQVGSLQMGASFDFLDTTSISALLAVLTTVNQHRRGIQKARNFRAVPGSGYQFAVRMTSNKTVFDPAITGVIV